MPPGAQKSTIKDGNKREAHPIRMATHDTVATVDDMRKQP